MALLELVHWYRIYHKERIAEALPQSHLLWREIKLIFAALLTIVLLGGFLAALAWYFTR